MGGRNYALVVKQTVVFVKDLFELVITVNGRKTRNKLTSKILGMGVFAIKQVDEVIPVRIQELRLLFADVH